MTRDIVRDRKFAMPFNKIIPEEYSMWNVMIDTVVVSETQIILLIQSQTKQNAIVVLDFCNSVVQS